MINCLVCSYLLCSKMYILFLLNISCFSSPVSNNYRVYLGLQNQQNPDPTKTRFLARIVRHPAYDATTKENDIALVQLATTSVFTDTLRPVCLAASDSALHDGTVSWTSGWGDSDQGGEATP